MDYNGLYECIKNSSEYSKYLYIDIIINNYYDDLIKCENFNDIVYYFRNNNYHIYYIITESSTKFVHRKNNHVVYGIKIVELLNYLKGDKYWINNEEIYNDFVFDLDNLIAIINYNKYKPEWFVYGGEYFDLFIFLFDIYLNESTEIFKTELTNKIIKILND
jgi:hypothetical protein